MRLRPLLLLTYAFAGLALAFSSLSHFARDRPAPAALAAVAGLAVTGVAAAAIRSRPRSGSS